MERGQHVEPRRSGISDALTRLAAKALRTGLLTASILAVLPAPLAQGGTRREDRRTEALPQRTEDGIAAREKLGHKWSEQVMEGIARTWLQWNADFDSAIMEFYIRERTVIPAGGPDDPVYTEIENPLLGILRTEGVGDPNFIIDEEIRYLERHKDGLEEQQKGFIADLKTERARIKQIYEQCLERFQLEVERLITIQAGENATMAINTGNDVLQGGFSQETLHAESAARKAQNMRKRVEAMVADLQAGKLVDKYDFSEEEGFEKAFVAAFYRAPQALNMIAAIDAYLVLVEAGDPQKVANAWQTTFAQRVSIQWERLAVDAGAKIPVTMTRLAQIDADIEGLKTPEITPTTPEEQVRAKILEWSKSDMKPEALMKLIREEEARLLKMQATEGLTDSEKVNIEGGLVFLGKAMDEIVVAKAQSLNRAHIPYGKQMEVMEEYLESLKERMTEIDHELYQSGLTSAEVTALDEEANQIKLAMASILEYEGKIAPRIPAGTSGRQTVASADKDITNTIRFAGKAVSGSAKTDRFGIGAYGEIDPFALDLRKYPVANLMRDLGLRAIAMRSSSGVLEWTIANRNRRRVRHMEPSRMLEDGLAIVDQAYGTSDTRTMLMEGRSKAAIILIGNLGGAAANLYRQQAANGYTLFDDGEIVVREIATELASSTMVPLATDDDDYIACSEVPSGEGSTVPLIDSDLVTNDTVKETAWKMCGDIERAISLREEGTSAELRLYIPNDRLHGNWAMPALGSTAMDHVTFSDVIYDLAGQQVVEYPATAGHPDLLGDKWLNPSGEDLHKRAVLEATREIEQAADEEK